MGVVKIITILFFALWGYSIIGKHLTSYLKKRSLKKRFLRSQFIDKKNGIEKEAEQLLLYLKSNLSDEEQKTLLDTITNKGEVPAGIAKTYNMIYAALKERLKYSGEHSIESMIKKYYYDYLSAPEKYPIENKGVKLSYKPIDNIIKYERMAHIDPSFLICICLLGVNNTLAQTVKTEVVRPKKIFTEEDIDPFRDMSIPFESLQEDYIYAIYQCCSGIESKHISKNALEGNQHINNEIEYFTKTDFTKYGNHYKNIYKKYMKKIPKNTDEANTYISDFINEYGTAIDRLVKRITKEYNKEMKELEKKEERLEKERIREEQYAKYKRDLGFELAGHITKYPLSSEEIGLRYEQYIGFLYENDGYEVIYSGATQGVKDGGRDLIASKDGTTFIIQCKNRKKDSQLHENTVNQLNTVYQKYAMKNPHLTDVRPLLITTNDNLDDEAKESIELFEIEHKVIPMSYDYPMIKCNINKATGKKIYHLPADGQYNRIKIRKKQGNFYCYTKKEAESRGFTRTKN